MKDKPFYYQDNRALHERKMNEAARLEISRRNIEFILEHQKDSAAELAKYLRRCQAELGHVPAQSEILGGDLLALRFGSWVNALEYSGFPVSTGPAVSNFPLERTALFQAEYERQSALHAPGCARKIGHSRDTRLTRADRRFSAAPVGTLPTAFGCVPARIPRPALQAFARKTAGWRTEWAGACTEDSRFVFDHPA